MRRVLLAFLFLLPATAREWKLNYFFDNARETLQFTDIASLSAQRAIAVGSIIDEAAQRMPRHVSLITIDGGDHWTELKLSDEPRSLFFLNESIGWMVTSRGLSKTDESGRTWRRVYRNSKLLAVWFLDEKHGFAAGVEKTFIETRDGGVTWKPVDIVKNAPGAKLVTAFTQIAFANEKIGLAIGTVFGNTRDTTLELETRDGGLTWQMATANLTGSIADLRLRGNSGLALFSFSRTAEFPTELFRLDLQSGKSTSVLRRKDRRIFSVSDVPGRTFLAAVEKPPRESSRARIPTRVRILETTDFKAWTESRVDYRAYATSAISAAFDENHAFIATDAGMILRLE